MNPAPPVTRARTGADSTSVPGRRPRHLVRRGRGPRGYDPRVIKITNADEYLGEQSASVAEFWQRFGVPPDVTGRQVLDVGCGRGVLSLRLAQGGASRVLGVDLDAAAVARARAGVDAFFPQVADRVEFLAADVGDLGVDQRFDLAVSKDAFEHIADLPAVLATLHRVLEPGGRLYAGFSPLYHSPFGDHGRTGLRVPWAHALLPRRAVVSAAARHWRQRFDTLLDLGLNGMTPAQFRAAFAQSPFEVESVLCNRGTEPLLRVLDRARGFAPLERFCTVSIYAVLRKAGDEERA